MADARAFEPTHAKQSYSVACGHCEARNAAANRFCEQCGLPLKDDVFELLYAPALRTARKWMGFRMT